MTSAEENVARVLEGAEAFGRGDVATFLEMLDPEVEIYSTPKLANPGTFHGREGYLRWSSDWFDAWDDFRIEIESVEAVGGRHVVADVRQLGRGKGSGVEVEMRAAYMWELRDGRAVRLQLHASREEAVDAAGAGEAPE
jgi:ketosteroid isomerase-like protein